ncbi:hypothetical protein KRX54_07255 [Actinomycetaceae bacterium TAE3-ERU4]|nr:hypothetical protein [Actinomycetaceae bacterium TAE3-ERU4]
MEKLNQQLQGASRKVILLTAELVFLREHLLRPALPHTRRSHIEGILKQINPTPHIPESMLGWLNRPSGEAGLEPGRTYNGHLGRHLSWMRNFIRYWNNLPAHARNDAQKLQQIMLDTGADHPDIRSALLFLAQPDIFEPIPSTTIKRKIRDAFASRINGTRGERPADLDQDLFAIRREVAQEFSGKFSFWQSDVIQHWNPKQSYSESNDTDIDKMYEPRAHRY